MSSISLVLIQSTTCLLLLMATLWLARTRTAAIKHMLCIACFVAILVIPIASFWLPKLQVLPFNISFHSAAGERISLDTAASTARESRKPAAIARSSATIDLPTLEPAGRLNNAKSASSTSTNYLKELHHILSHTAIEVWALGVWAVGVFLLLIRLLAGNILLFRRSRAGTEIKEGREFETLMAICAGHELTCSIRLLQSHHRSMPMTWGITQPQLMIPTDTGEWCDQQLESVLLHEVEHIRRRDALWNFLIHFTCAIYWFHPLAWLAAGQAFRESEQSCDDGVLQSGIAPTLYAKHILNIASEYGTSQLSFGAAAMSQTSAIESRIIRVLDASQVRESVSTGAILSTGCLTLLCITAVSVVRATPPPAVSNSAFERFVATSNNTSPFDDEESNPAEDENNKKPRNEAPSKPNVVQVEIKATLHVIDDQSNEPLDDYRLNLGQLDGTGKRGWFGNQVTGRWGPPKQKKEGTLIQAYAQEARPHWVQIEKSGYVPAIMTEEPLHKLDGRTFTIRLKRGKRQQVSVRNSLGAPVANALVLLVRDDVPSFYVHHNYEQRDVIGDRRFGVTSVTRVRTDDRGMCLLTGIDDKSDRIAVLTPQGRFHVFPLTLQNGAMEVQMPDDTLLTMVANPPEKFPAQYFQAERDYEAKGLWRGISVHLKKRIGRKSAHKITGLPAGDYEVRRYKDVDAVTYKQGYYLDAKTVNLSDKTEAKVVFTHRQGRTLRGKISNLKKRQMVGAAILFHLQGTTPKLYSADEAIACTADGTFEAELAPGKYRFQINAQANPRLIGSISIGGPSVTVTGEIVIPATGMVEDLHITLPEPIDQQHIDQF